MHNTFHVANVRTAIWQASRALPAVPTYTTAPRKRSGTVALCARSVTVTGKISSDRHQNARIVIDACASAPVLHNWIRCAATELLAPITAAHAREWIVLYDAGDITSRDALLVSTDDTNLTMYDNRTFQARPCTALPAGQSGQFRVQPLAHIDFSMRELQLTWALRGVKWAAAAGSSE